MEVEKIRNLSDDELALEGRKASEQLFRLRFQMKLGQTEGVKKLRELKKDVARINTITRERELGIHSLVAPKHHAHADAAEEHEAEAPAKQAKKKVARPAKKKAAAKKPAAHKASGRSAAARKSTAKPSANKKAASRSTSVKKG
ncbi:MAG: 50S ribosomal protein L29 [Acidobacteriaceae bacterium]|jgi:large subunit ribosomal protein L29